MTTIPDDSVAEFLIQAWSGEAELLKVVPAGFARPPFHGEPYVWNRPNLKCVMVEPNGDGRIKRTAISTWAEFIDFYVGSNRICPWLQDEVEMNLGVMFNEDDQDTAR